MKVPQVAPVQPAAPTSNPVFKSIMFLLVFLILAASGLLVFSHQILTVDSGENKADAIILLGGGANQQRPDRAAELFKKGLAPFVLVSGTGDFELNVLGLEKNGVPESAIIIEDRSKSTLQNAKFSLEILRRKGVHRAIIVTSWYHSRRALQCFEQLGPDLQFTTCPSYWGYSFSEWFNRGVISYVVYEYVKLLGYWICYGVRPF